MKILNLTQGVYDFDTSKPFMVYNPEHKICEIYGDAVLLNGEACGRCTTEKLFIIIRMSTKNVYYGGDIVMF